MLKAVLHDALHSHRGKNRMSHFVHGRYAYLCVKQKKSTVIPTENSIKIEKQHFE